MAHSNGVISAPVRLLADIQPILGVSGGLAYCYAHGSIKKWALHKPVRLIDGYDTPVIPQTDWLNYMKTKVRERDNNVLCPYALKVNSSTNLYEVIGAVSAPAVDWVYQQPTESGSFFRRMHDVDGYSTSPNPPLNPIGTLNYFNDTANELMIDTNDGEAGGSSIQIRELTHLDSYKLMVAVKEGSLWWIAVMSSVISQSMEPGVYSISFMLPTNHEFSTGQHEAYVVGLAANSGVSENWWNQLTDSAVRNFSSMLPLPFPNKTDCKFNFNVQAVTPTNIVYLSYTLYVKRGDYRLAEIEFWAEKQGQTPAGFSLSASNIVVHDDYETQTWPISEAFLMNAFTYNATTRKSTCAVRKNLLTLGYSIYSGDHPNLTFLTQITGGYTVQEAGFDVVYID